MIFRPTEAGAGTFVGRLSCRRRSGEGTEHARIYDLRLMMYDFRIQAQATRARRRHHFSWSQPLAPNSVCSVSSVGNDRHGSTPGGLYFDVQSSMLDVGCSTFGCGEAALGFSWSQPLAPEFRVFRGPKGLDCQRGPQRSTGPTLATSIRMKSNQLPYVRIYLGPFVVNFARSF
jgi:hypothetical protein